MDIKSGTFRQGEPELTTHITSSFTLRGFEGNKNMFLGPEDGPLVAARRPLCYGAGMLWRRGSGKDSPKPAQGRSQKIGRTAVAKMDGGSEGIRPLYTQSVEKIDQLYVTPAIALL